MLVLDREMNDSMARCSADLGAWLSAPPGDDKLVGRTHQTLVDPSLDSFL